MGEAVAGAAAGAASGAGGLLGALSPMGAITGGIQALTSIASTVAQIQDAKKKTDIQRNLGYLDEAQKLELENQLQRTNDINKKMEILINAVSNIRAAQTSSILSATITSRALSKSKQDTTTAFIVIGGAVAILIAIVLLKKD